MIAGGVNLAHGDDLETLEAAQRFLAAARLYPVPGKNAGKRVRFDNPCLTETTVTAPD